MHLEWLDEWLRGRENGTIPKFGPGVSGFPWMSSKGEGFRGAGCRV